MAGQIYPTNKPPPHLRLRQSPIERQDKIVLMPAPRATKNQTLSDRRCGQSRGTTVALAWGVITRGKRDDSTSRKFSHFAFSLKEGFQPSKPSN